MNLTNTRAKQDKRAVTAIFKNQESLEKTLNELKARNFKTEDISILMAKHKDLHNIDYNLLSRDVATTGLMYGLATGGILGWLVGLNIITIPGVGFFVAAGPLAGALTGLALGGTIGSISGALIGLGISKIEAQKLEKYVKEKGVIISVHSDDAKAQLLAKNILVINGAVKVFNPSRKGTSTKFKTFLKSPARLRQ
ncbi:MAG: hypothetical protein WC635_17290 [Bacteriovorax sp.]|jgi:hypothetical protein